jgi:hypothetical protein
MTRAWIGSALAALTALAPGLVAPVAAEPTKYCGDRIAEAADTVKAIEGGLGHVKNAQDRTEIEAWVGQAKTHIGAARSAAQEEECVREVELAKTLTQDALYLAAQGQ